jgi:hypothetical protein
MLPQVSRCPQLLNPLLSNASGVETAAAAAAAFLASSIFSMYFSHIRNCRILRITFDEGLERFFRQVGVPFH